MSEELIGCDLDPAEAITLLQQCEKESVSLSEKLHSIIQNFLPKGDNHLLKNNSSSSAPFLP